MNYKQWVYVTAVLASVMQHGSFAKSTSDEEQPSQSTGSIVQSMFRFPASRLGPEFDDLLDIWHGEWMHAPVNGASNATTTKFSQIIPDPSGTKHATRAVTSDAATLFRRQCYSPAPSISTELRNLYKNLEQRRKEIEFQYLKDPMEEMRLLHTMVRRFYPAFLPIAEDDVGRGRKSRQSHQRGATQIHKKKSKSKVNTIYASTPAYNTPSELSYQTVSNSNDNNQTQQWTWRPSGHFSARGTPSNREFRMKFFRAMRQQFQQRLTQQNHSIPDFNGLEKGRPSGIFWYPPGGVREWHSNYLDLVGSVKNSNLDRNGVSNKRDEEIFASQVWRMYFVRVVRDDEFDDKLEKLQKSNADSNNETKEKHAERLDKTASDHSAMHIIPGDDSGITLDVLRKAGARPLTSAEKSRQKRDIFASEYSSPPERMDEANDNDADEEKLDRNSVWRIPDQDGYVTLFRLPDLWHCIVSEEVHRYSLGFAFSDKEVQALLALAGEEFDVKEDEEYRQKQEEDGRNDLPNDEL